MSLPEASVISCQDPSQGRCADGCFALDRDPTHCGSCARACPSGAGATARCRGGLCGLTCERGRADCDGRVDDGCEADLLRDPMHCGGCGLACGAATNGTARCEAGSCALTCNDSYGDCDGRFESGCEALLPTDPENCGACDRRCPWPRGTALLCESGACAFACTRPYADCNRAQDDGCETTLVSARNCGACGRVCAASAPLCADIGGAPGCVSECPGGTVACDGACVRLGEDPLNCGACGRVCPQATNAQPACRAGRCELECRVGYADCDGNAANGCEVSLARSTLHCGRCGEACRGGFHASALCIANACATRCEPGFGNCDRNAANGCETTLANDPRHCGACGRACADAVNARGVCEGGACALVCVEGFASCDGDDANGCESALRVDAANCGACGHRCGAGESCVAGRCTSSACPPGLASCGAGGASCEADLRTSVMHCGACNAACALANATAACNGGVCSVATCAAGFGDCDRNAANGCERSLTADLANCGGCGVACAAADATSVCNAGRCELRTCALGFADCDALYANGCEVDLQRDAQHCGACGQRCLAGQRCAAGRCEGATALSDAGADGDDGADAALDAGPTGDGGDGGDAALDGGACGRPGVTECTVAGGGTQCFDLRSDARNCGACGHACAVVENCVAGVCVCAVGQRCGARCVETASDEANCGACGRACAAGQSCAAGACVCPAGQTLCGGACVTPDDDEANCGACGRACGRGQSCVGGACVCPMGLLTCGSGASAVCADPQHDVENCGACGVRCAEGGFCAPDGCRCNPGFTRCGDRCVDTTSDRSHCGGCALPCPTAMLCANSVCTNDCAAGQSICGTGAAARCVDLQTDTNNCSSCGFDCAVGANVASASCAMGRCAQTCAAGFRDCNADLRDGCESQSATDTNNCGACGTRCPGSTLPGVMSGACVMGACQIRCLAGFADCNNRGADGCEVSTDGDAMNCGACGRVCPGGLRCVNGACETANCAALHTLTPSLVSGIYSIDTDAAGPLPPVSVYCDMSTAGGGWTLVGRSRPGGVPYVFCEPDDGLDGFGWRAAAGSVTDDTMPYSLDAYTTGLSFTELLFGVYATGKTWGDRYFRVTVGPNFIETYADTALGPLSATELSRPRCTDSGPYAPFPGMNPGPPSLENSDAFRYIGWTHSTMGFVMRHVDDEGFGLYQTGWRTCYLPTNCFAGGLNTRQGMIMVR